MPIVTPEFLQTMAAAARVSITPKGLLTARDGQRHRLAPGPDGVMEDRTYLTALEWIRQVHGDDPGLMLAYAGNLQLDRLGVLGLAVKTAPTIGVALDLVARYFRLMTDTVRYSLDETGTHLILSLQEQSAPHPALDFRTECALFTISRLLRGLAIGNLSMDHISLRHACRSDPTLYFARLGLPLHFKASEDALHLSLAARDMPTRLGDVAVNRFLVQHLESELARLHPGAPFLADLLRHLTDALKDGAPQAGDLARTVGLSERTLYRRLAEKGLTYRDLLRQAQTKLAQELLTESDCSIAEIAFRTGFAEQSTFSRAFKRWVGQAPAQYRQQAAP
jgi:AraC-like DNA-binding protein